MSSVLKEKQISNLFIKPRLHKYDPVKVNIATGHEGKRQPPVIVNRTKDFTIDIHKIAQNVNKQLGIVVNKNAPLNKTNIATPFKDVYNFKKVTFQELDVYTPPASTESDIFASIDEPKIDEPANKITEDLLIQDKEEKNLEEEKEVPAHKEQIEPVKQLLEGAEVAVKKRKRAVKINILAEPTEAEQENAREELKLKEKLPKPQPIALRAPTYYMTNRKQYTQKLADLFKVYNEKLLSDESKVSCDTRGGNEFDLMIHQKIVRDYLNLYTPYRGLLIYHGLGSGKTCTSIAVAEGMKSHRKVIVMTPASLAPNFFEQLKKCGDHVYRRNQYWEFVSTEGRPDYVHILSEALSLPREHIMSRKGAWMVDVSKSTANYTLLGDEDRKQLDEQINAMIHTKYEEVHYNGLVERKVMEWTKNKTVNPFDNSVVIIDEAHNFVSRIVNKLSEKQSTNYLLYQYLLTAQNAKIVLLSGTPIINYPHEIAIMYNILRGHIKTWTFTITSKGTFNPDALVADLNKNGVATYDFVDYADGKLHITRNPFGFVNVTGMTNPKTKMEHEIHAAGKTRKQVGKGINENKRGTRRRNNIFNEKNMNKINNNSYVNPIMAKVKIDKSHSSGEELDELMHISAHEEKQLKMANQAREDNVYDLHKGEELQMGGGLLYSNAYTGVTYDELGNVSDAVFIDQIKNTLNKMGVKYAPAVKVTNYKCLPDIIKSKFKKGKAKEEKTEETFSDWFIDENTKKFKNADLFKRRILGLTSYFRSAQESLLPSYVTTEKGEEYHVVRVPMSEYQFHDYAKIRLDEIDKEKKMKKVKNLNLLEDVDEIASSYRIYSRSCCNFSFPPGTLRPRKKYKEENEKEEPTLEEVDLIPRNNVFQENEQLSPDDIEKLPAVDADKVYLEDVKNAMLSLKTNAGTILSREGLAKYSPKFLSIMENVSNPENRGIHLLYSNFRTIEGIGILKTILESNGFAQFKIRKSSGTWVIDHGENPAANANKPKFVLYTGTEQEDEKKIILDIYNGDWDIVPTSITEELRKKAENNNLGEVIKLIMITSSGAEGIDLKNTRFVHITEPYWHMVRIDQVVGRARRICSHKALPVELRTVKVFLYMSVFSKEQISNRNNIELMQNDMGNDSVPNTTDEYLFNIASTKNTLSNQILKAIKEAAVDCALYKSGHKKENLVCYGAAFTTTNDFSSYPMLEVDSRLKEDLNVRKEKIALNKIKIPNVDKIFAHDPKTNNLYDWAAYQNDQLVVVGEIVKKDGKTQIKLNK